MSMTISQLIENIKDDARLLLAARQGQLQLKAVEKGVPVAVKSIYVSFIAALTLLLLPILFVTGALAFGLIFASPGDVYQTLRSLTLGFCCMDVAQLVIIGLLIVLMKPITTSIEAGIINDMLDKMEEKERETAEKNRIKRNTYSNDSAEETEATEVIRVNREDTTYTDDTNHER